MKSFVILMLGTLMLGTLVFAAEPTKPENVLYVFGADWCPNCKQMAPIVDKIKKSGIKVVYVDTDNDVVPAADGTMVSRSRSVGVAKLPTFVVFRHSGPKEPAIEIGRIVGTSTEIAIRNILNKKFSDPELLKSAK